MIKSKFVLDIFDLLLDGDEEGIFVRHQIDSLTEIKYDYTGVGVFIYFAHTDQTAEYKSSKTDLVLLGVVIKSPDLIAGAEANLFFKNGIIDYLEIWSQDGEYPTKEPTNYTLTQEWHGSPGKQIISDNKTSA